MSPKPSDPVSVRGGSAGIAADLDEILRMAHRFGAASSNTLASAWHLHGYLADPSLALSAVLDPVGWAEFEGELLFALDGVHGLTWAGLEAGVIDGELRVAAAGYRAADELSGGRDALFGVLKLPFALAAAAQELGRTGDPLAAAEAGIARDPELADDVVDILGIPTLLAATARILPDGRGVLRNVGVDASAAGEQPPRQLTDLLVNLARRNGDTHHGEIDVRILTMPNGSRRVIVDITGTKSWDPLPTHDITSLSTNGRALVGERTAYEAGVLAAMRAAGVQSGDDVMLVGHSEGGMVAVTTARDAVASGEFTVTHVVTAGAPIGRTVGSIAPSVRILALENSLDVVPHLDGVANPDTSNVITASSRHGNNTIAGDHDITRSYVPVAADVQVSHHRAIRDFLTSARGYFGAATVQTHTYQVQRA